MKGFKELGFKAHVLGGINSVHINGASQFFFLEVQGMNFEF